MTQIYNEMIRDLLNPGSGYLDLREDQKGVQVAGLSEHSAANTDQVSELLRHLHYSSVIINKPSVLSYWS